MDPRTKKRFRSGIWGAAVAGLFCSSCFGPENGEPGTVEILTGKTWFFQEASFDLGVTEGNTVAFGKGDTAVLGLDSMRVFSDSIPSGGNPDNLFPNGRACFYGVKWENPGTCRLDDIWKFSSGGSLSVDAGATLCDSGENQTRSGSWSLGSGETELTVTLDGEAKTFKLESRKASEFRISETEPDSVEGCALAVHVKTLYRFTAR